MPEYIDEELTEARGALSDARVLQEGGGRDEAIVNRLYYACFHAAQAVLYSKGFDPETHSGVVSLFGEHVVLPGEVGGEAGRHLNQLRNYRRQADYGYEPLEADVSTLFEQSEQFIRNMEAIV